MTGRRWPALYCGLLTLLVLLDHSIANASNAHAGRQQLQVGVTYTPNHNAEYPTLGGWISKDKLCAAIDADLQLLSKYFTHIRTLSATYFGCDVAPIAAKNGLRVYLGAKRYLSSHARQLEARAVVEAIRRYPQTIAAVIVGDNDLFDQEYNVYWANASLRFSYLVRRSSEIISRINEIKSQVGTTSVKFGTLDTFEWLPRIHQPVVDYQGNVSDSKPFRDQVMADLQQLDILGVQMRSWSAEDGDKQWAELANLLPADKTFFVETNPQLYCQSQYQPPDEPIQPNSTYEMNCVATAQRDHDSFASWRPQTDKISLLLWSSAFDGFPDDIENGASSTSFFDFDRMRKFQGIPRPRDRNEDPAKLPASPRNATCPMGMYHQALFETKGLVRLCASGHNFRNPTKFDEFSIKAACENPFCHAVVAALRRIPSPPPCPFDSFMTEQMLRELILQPFENYCGGNDDIVIEEGDYNPVVCVESPSSAAESHFQVAKTNKSELMRCENVGNFSLPSIANREVQPLTQEALEKMCFRSACESLFFQMANPKKRLRCDSAKQAYEESIVVNVLMPYYDGCYEPSPYPTEYYDTTYKRRRVHPRLPSLPDTPTPSDVITIPPTTAHPPRPHILELSSSSSFTSSSSSQDEPPNSEDAPHRRTSKPRSKKPRPPESTAPGNSSFEFHLDPANHAKPPNMTDRTQTDQTPKQQLGFLSPSDHPFDTSPEPTPVTASSKEIARPQWYLGVMSGVVVMVVVGFIGHRRLQRPSTKAASANYAPMSPTDTGEMSSIRRGSTGTSFALIHGPQSVLSDPALSKLFIPPQSMRDVRLIGSGGQALVYLVETTIENVDNEGKVYPRTMLASKRLSKHYTTSDSQLVLDFVEEIKLMASLRHPNIVALVGATWTTGHDIQALLEFMPDGDLCSYLSFTPRYDWNATKLQLAIDVAEALAYVHTLEPPLVHRDIKSRNVLLRREVSDETSNEETFRAKLTDFGVSRRHSERQTMTTGVGTSRWLAPEVILGGGDYDQSCDIYSFGVLLSELDTHELPFMDRRTPTGDAMPIIAILEQIASEGIRPSFTASCPGEILALAHSCLAYEPSARPSAVEIGRQLRGIQSALLSCKE